MALKFTPHKGQIVLCDYNTGFKPPEMVKRRPVVVISPRFSERRNLCTIVPLSTTPPEKIMPYHCQIELPNPPPKVLSKVCWVKADMIAAVGLERLDFITTGKDGGGKRLYYKESLSTGQISLVEAAILASLGIEF